MEEQDIQKQAIDYLTLKNWFVWKNTSVGIYNKKTGKYIKAQTKGISDLTAIKNGFVVFLEIKTPKGILSEHQKKFQKDIEDHNGNYFVCRSLEDAIKLNTNIDEVTYYENK